MTDGKDPGEQAVLGRAADTGIRSPAPLKGSAMESLHIDEAIFRDAFDRDVIFHDAYFQTTYLDRATGTVEWVYEEDNEAEIEGPGADENQSLKKMIEADPGRFIVIPGLSHDEHHQVLQDFLDSDWTDNEVNKKFALESYFRSIGGWKEQIPEDSGIIEAWETHQEKAFRRLAIEFLQCHGIKPDWP